MSDKEGRADPAQRTPQQIRFMWPDCSLLLAGHDAVMPLTQEILSMATPDEERRFPLGRFELFILGGQTVGRAVYAPGWRWSEHIAPTAGTDWCEIGHLGLVIAGRAAVRMKDGTELQMGPGDLFSIPPGHDSWVLGDQEYVSLHFLGAQRYASPEGAGQTDALAPVPAGQDSVPVVTWGEGCQGLPLLSRPDLHVQQERMAPGTSEQRHRHMATVQLYFILEGTGTVELAGAERVVRERHAIEIPAGREHRIRNEERGVALEFLVISSKPPREDRLDL